MGRGSKSKKKFSGRELHRQIQSGGGPEVGISAIINYSIMFIYCKQHMFVIYVLPCCSSTSDAPRDSKLLNILHDARSNLSSTGRTMQKQGQQIDSACAISRLLPASKISSDFFDSTKVPGKCFSL